MPNVTSLDIFIERSCRLMDARPASTVSITYGSQAKKAKTAPAPTDKVSKKATSFVAVKTYDPTSGVCYRIKLSKAKELSRVLTLLGPRGVQLTKNHKSASLGGADEEMLSKKEKKAKINTYIVQERGIASIMTNVVFKEEVPDVVMAEPKETTPVVEATAPKTKKKKNKKR